MKFFRLISIIFICIIFTITMIGGCISVPNPPQSDCIWENSKISCFYMELNYPSGTSFNVPNFFIYSFADFFYTGNFVNSESLMSIAVSSDECIGCTNNTFTINQDSYYEYYENYGYTENFDYTMNNVPFITNIEPKFLNIKMSFKISDVYDFSSGRYGSLSWLQESNGYSAGFVFDTLANTFNINSLVLQGKFIPQEYRIAPVYYCGEYVIAY